MVKTTIITEEAEAVEEARAVGMAIGMPVRRM